MERPCIYIKNECIKYIYKIWVHKNTTDLLNILLMMALSSEIYKFLLSVVGQKYHNTQGHTVTIRHRNVQYIQQYSTLTDHPNPRIRHIPQNLPPPRLLKRKCYTDRHPHIRLNMQGRQLLPHT
jgi:hypothetical protein